MSTAEQNVDAEPQSGEMEISMVTEVVEEAVISDTLQPRHDSASDQHQMVEVVTTGSSEIERSRLTPPPAEVDQTQEPAVELVMEVIETSHSGDHARQMEGGVTMEAGKNETEPVMEYAISQVVSGDIQDQPNPMEVATDLPMQAKSAFVTLFDPLQRDTIIAYAEQTSINQASRRFKVPATTIKKWMNSSTDSTYTKTRFNSPGQGRKLSYSQDKDDRIATHIREKVARGEKITMQYVCNYAKNIIKEECPQFVASTGWAQRFLVRHAIDIGMPRLTKRKNSDTPETNRGRPLSYSSSTDRAIADYVRGKLAEGQHMTNSEIRKYAKEIISKENPNFTGSASWAQNFLLRHKIALQSMSNMSLPLTGAGSSSSSSPPSSSPQVPLVSSAASTSLVSMSPSLSDASLVPAEITPTSSSHIYSDASMATLDNVVDDPMKTALALLTGENIDMTMLSTAQVAALQTSLSELTSDAISLVDLLSNTQQLQDAGEEGGVALMASGLESPSSGNVYLNLGGSSEGFGSGLTGPVATQVNPNTQTPLVPAAGHIPEVVAQSSRPLSYAKETDQVLASWVQSQQAEGKKVTFASLRSYAKQLIASENPNFTASVGWVTPFLLRHNLDLNINKKLKLKTSRKGTPRKMASKESKDTPEDVAEEEEEEEGVGVNGNESTQVEVEGSSEMQYSDTNPPAITPEVLATALASTFAEAVLAQQQQQQQQGEQQTVEQPSIPVEPSENLADESITVLPVEGDIQSIGAEHVVATKKPKKSPKGERVRFRHTLAEKLEVVQLMKEYGVAAHYVCRMLGIANSTYAGWTKLVQQKGAELQALSTNKKRANVSGQGRPLSYSREKDEQIAQWVKNQKEAGTMVTPAELAKQATMVISQENPNFTASSGWQQKFLQRHRIQLSSSWGQKSTSSSSAGTEDKHAAGTQLPPVLEDTQNIPTAVQTEEVLTNDLSATLSDKSYSDETERELAAWVREKQAVQETVSVQSLCKRAEEMISKEIPSFVATLGWAFKFLHRNSLMLDPKPSLCGIMETSRKRPSTDTPSSVGSPDHSKYLNTPKKARHLYPSSDVTISPSTGNLCEALLALSNQNMAEGGGELASSQVLQAAMQNLQTVMQQALQQQQQLQLQEQQLQLQEQQEKEQQPQPSQPEGDQQQLEPLPPPKEQLQPVSLPLTSPPSIATVSHTSSHRKASPSSGSVPGTPGTGTSCNNYFGKPAREFTPEEKEEVVRYANATTLLKAAIKYGVAAPTVWRWRVELKLHQPKYTPMQKKYIIKFAETNSLKEASQRYGITSKTIQNWRRGLQAEGDLGTTSPSTEEPHAISRSADQMLEAPPNLPRVTGSTGDSNTAEVVTYDNQNFQFIIDGGEVSDTNGRGEQGSMAPDATPMRVDPVPLEVTNEVDIENVGMEYDVISSEGHAAKPRCTAHEKMQILQYAIEHSVREASQKYGISPGTLYYWKKTSMSGSGNTTGGGGPSGSTSLTPLGSISGGDKYSTRSASAMMNMYSENSSLILEQIQGSGTAGAPETDGSSKVGGEQYLTGEVVSSTLPPGSDVNFLQAVSSLLNSAESASRATEAGASGDLSPRTHTSRQTDGISGGISSPTEVLVTPLQVASEEMAVTTIEEGGEIESQMTPADKSEASIETEKVVESIVGVGTDPSVKDVVMEEEGLDAGGDGVVITDGPVEEVVQEVVEQEAV